MLGADRAKSRNEIAEGLERVARGRLDTAVAPSAEASPTLEGAHGVVHVVGNLVTTIDTQSRSLSAALGHLSSAAASTREGAATLRQAAGESAQASASASENLATLASASTEMSAATHEIARSTQQSALTVRGARDKLGQTHGVIQRLTESSKRVGSATGVIDAIASQTKLLALNASIEAARSGAAGKGFAVVAGEVKALSGETAKATADIAEVIERLRRDVNEAVVHMDGALGLIADLDGMVQNVAGAVEEQAATVTEFDRNVVGVQDHVRTMDGAMQELAREADSFQDIAENLVAVQETLTDMVSASSALSQLFVVDAKVVAEAGGRASLAAHLTAICFMHLQWRDKLLRGVLSRQEPDVQTDPTKCALGKWLCGYVPRGDEERRIITSIQPVHERLHRTAVGVIEKTRAGACTRELLRMVHGDITPCLTETWALLVRLIAEVQNGDAAEAARIGAAA